VAEPLDARLFPYADHVLDRLEAESGPATALKEAAAARAALLIDFHPHGDGSGWCAAIRVEGREQALVHLRGIAKQRADCTVLGRVLAGLMAQRYRLATPPRIALEGVLHYA